MQYKAFISYSHAADGKLAPALQRALHRIAKPWYRLRSMRVFRDETNLATSPGLWTVIEAALRDSEFFIYLASPNAAASPWVQKEVLWWIANRSPQTFLIVVTDGVLAWDNSVQDLDWTVTTAMPRQLGKAFMEEPLFTDIRWARQSEQLSLRHSRFRAAILELAATLLNRSKDELDGEDVRQYRRTRRLAWSAAGVLGGLFVIASFTAWLATQQSLLATSRSLSARSEAILPTNPELALLLAREALRFREDEQAEYALRRAFLRNPERMIHHSQPGRTLVAKFVGGDLVIAAEPGKRPTVWSANDGKRRGELVVDADDRLNVVAVSVTHSLIAVPNGKTRFTLLDAKTLKPLAEVPGVNLRISRDGKVLTTWQEKKIQQWEVPELLERKVAASLPTGFEVRNVSPDGNLLMLAKEAELSEIIVVHASSGRVIARLPQSILYEGSGFSADGRFVISMGKAGESFQLWDVHSGKARTLEKPSYGDIGWTTFIAVSPDGKMLVSGNRSGALHTWELETGTWAGLHDTTHRNDIRSIEFSPDGESMLSVGVDGNACLWDVAAMRCLVVIGGKGDDAWDIGFSADSRLFLTTHIDGTVRVWDRRRWHPSKTLAARGELLADSGRLVLDRTEQGSLRLWDIETGSSKVTLEANAGEFSSLAIDGPATLVAIAPEGRPAELWSLKTGKHLTHVGSSEATAVALSKDGRQVVTGTEGGKIYVWSAPDGNPMGEWQASKEKVARVALHPHGHRLAVATADGRLLVRDMKSGAVVLEAGLNEEGSVPQALTFSGDGNFLLYSGDKFPQVWDLRTLRRAHILAGHEDDVFDVAFSSDGTLVLSASGFFQARGTPPDSGNAVHLWDMRTGRILLSYLSAQHVVKTVSFLDGDTKIIAGSLDGKARRYDCEVCLSLPRLVQLTSSRLARELTDDERQRYLPQSALLEWIADRLPSR